MHRLELLMKLILTMKWDNKDKEVSMVEIYMKIKRSEYLEMKKTIQILAAENLKLKQAKEKAVSGTANASAAQSEKAASKKGDK